jgi:type IV pilus assembly protein PilN
MRNLDDSPWFESARLIEIKAATVTNLRANEFVLEVKQTRQQADDAKDSKGGKA